jgi:hypothetical protein
VRDGSAQLNIVQRVGGSIGTAVATVVLQQALSRHASTDAGAAAAFRYTYWWLFIVAVVALAPAFWLLVIERRTRDHEPDARLATNAALETALEVL